MLLLLVVVVMAAVVVAAATVVVVAAAGCTFRCVALCSFGVGGVVGARGAKRADRGKISDGECGVRAIKAAWRRAETRTRSRKLPSPLNPLYVCAGR